MIEINLEEMAHYMANKTKIPYDTALHFLELEDDYYDTLGINVYDCDDISKLENESNELSKQNIEDLDTAKKTGVPIFDEVEFCKYVCANTDKISLREFIMLVRAETQFNFDYGIEEPWEELEYDNIVTEQYIADFVAEMSVYKS